MILTIWLEQTNWRDQQPIKSQSNDQLESTKVDTPGWRLRVSRSLATKKNQSVVGGRRSVGFGVQNAVFDVEMDRVSETFRNDTCMLKSLTLESLVFLSCPRHLPSKFYILFFALIGTFLHSTCTCALAALGPELVLKLCYTLGAHAKFSHAWMCSISIMSTSFVK